MFSKMVSEIILICTTEKIKYTIICISLRTYSYKYTNNYTIFCIRIHVSILYKNCGLLYEYH